MTLLIVPLVAKGIAEFRSMSLLSFKDISVFIRISNIICLKSNSLSFGHYFIDGRQTLLSWKFFWQRSTTLYLVNFTLDAE